MNCPKCGSSNVKATNLLARAVSTSFAFVVGAVVGIVTRSASGGDIYKNLRENICDRETWRCRNCGNAFTMLRSV